MNTRPLAKPAPLGRGLSALFGDADSSYQALAPVAPQPAPAPAATAQPTVTSAPREGAPQTLPVAWLQPGAYQPRRHFAEDGLQELAESIRGRGVIQPLLVRPLTGEKDSYEIIAGERRWRAAQIAGVHEVPVLVKTLTDREAMEIALIENIQRQDLSPIEEAEGYQRLMQEFSRTQEDLARIVGKSRPHITNMLRLLTLPADVKQLVDNGKLSMGQARAIITAPNPSELAVEIIKRGLNVRQAEALAQKANDGKFAKKKTQGAPESVNADILALEKDLERVVGLRVKIHAEGTKGSMTLYYADLDQLEGIIARLRG